MHVWGDKDVDWQGIDDAASYIGDGLRFWGRVSVSQYKEKYGTVRVYCSLGLWDWHQLTHPGYAFNQWPKWLWPLNFKGQWLMRLLNLYKLQPAQLAQVQEAWPLWPLPQLYLSL